MNKLQRTDGGNWVCQCGNENFPNRLFCNRTVCGLAKPGLTAAEMSGQSQASSGNWECQCGNENFPNRNFCNRKSCGLAKPGLTAADLQKAGMLPPNHQQNQQRQQHNQMQGGGSNDVTEMMRLMMQMMGMTPPQNNMRGGGKKASAPQDNSKMPEGSWICTACLNVNYPNRDTCNKNICGRTRAECDGGPPPGQPGSIASDVSGLPPPEGSWNCLACGNLNWPRRTTCNRKMCSQPRTN